MFKKTKEKKKVENLQNEIDLAIGMEMEKYAEANLQHFSSIPELKKISKSKINPDYEKTNYQQQSGFSAEVKHKARYNAEKILNGENDRIERTDNIGDVNHPKYDHVKVDKNGNPTLDQNGNYIGGSQQKNFYKIENYDKLYKKEYEHYKDTPIDIASDHYDPLIKRWNNNREKLINQEKYLRKQSKIEEANNIKKKIDQIDNVSKRLRKSKVSSKNAMEARKNYKKSVAKDIGKISHKAGIKAAKTGVVMGGVMSTVGNTKAVIDGDIDIEDALLTISTDTIKSASKSYINASSSSVIGGALKASNNQILENLSKKNGPAAIVATAGILAKQTTKLISGEISAEEYAQNITVEGFSLASSITGSNIGAIAGTFIVPGAGTVVGGFIGGMVTSMLSSATYGELMRTIQDTKLSDEKRKIMSEYCNKLKEEEVKHRKEMQKTFDIFFQEKENVIRNGFEAISDALSKGESINSGLEEVAKAFGFKLAFASTEEFAEHIKKNKILEL